MFNFSNNLQGKSRSMFIETCPVRFILLVLAPTCAASGKGLAGSTVDETGIDGFFSLKPNSPHFPEQQFHDNFEACQLFYQLVPPFLPCLGFRASTFEALCPPFSAHDQCTFFFNSNSRSLIHILYSTKTCYHPLHKAWFTRTTQT